MLKTTGAPFLISSGREGFSPRVGGAWAAVLEVQFSCLHLGKARREKLNVKTTTVVTSTFSSPHGSLLLIFWPESGAFLFFIPQLKLWDYPGGGDNKKKMGEKASENSIIPVFIQVLTFLPYPPAILFFRVLWWLLFCSVQFLVVISGRERERGWNGQFYFARARIGIHIFNALVLQMNWQWRILRHLEKFPIWETNKYRHRPRNSEDTKWSCQK